MITENIDLSTAYVMESDPEWSSDLVVLTGKPGDDDPSEDGPGEDDVTDAAPAESDAAADDAQDSPADEHQADDSDKDSDEDKITSDEADDEKESSDKESDEDERDEVQDEAPVIEVTSSGTSALLLAGSFGAGVLITAFVAVLICLIRGRKKKLEKYEQTQQGIPHEMPVVMQMNQGNASQVPPTEDYATLSAGKLHNIGKRSEQQDSFGMLNVPGGILAVVADGMGGLSNGQAVSQKIVYTMMNDANGHTAAQLSGNLNQMVSHANAEVNQMLGYRTEYVSGSTLVSVLARPDSFEIISIGDSRIYLYRNGCMLQLNREHVYRAELNTRAINREIGFAEAYSHDKGKNVTSFIGMGDLKYVDEPLSSFPAKKGDRIILTSDGVFNTLSDDEIGSILGRYNDPNEAAAALEAAVLARNNPKQDNFTSILLFYQ